MTDDELKALNARICNAAEAKLRVDRLQEALVRVQRGSVDAIVIGFSEDRSQLEYFTPKRKEPQPVCWADSEPDLRAEFHAAVIAVLERRLKEANAAFDAI